MSVGGICKRLAAALLVIPFVAVPAVAAAADMRGVDISNWQCGINVAALDADFVVVGTTWGAGGISNTCLRNGVNTDANRMIAGARMSGKSVGVYHYARGMDAREEADFFVDNVVGYIGNAVLALDWEAQDNRAWGDSSWVDRFVSRVYERTKVWPVVYVQASALSQVSAYVRQRCGVWVAEYASMAATGWQSQPWRYGWYGEAMRQYTSNGRIAGYSGPLDLNYFRGERWQWEAYATGDRGKTAVPAPVPAPAPSTPAPNVSSGSCVVVRSGDTLSGIAERTGLRPWSAWSGYRSGNPSVIYPGETVCYRGGGATVAPAVRTYTVRAGDSLWSVFGADWSRVARLNGLANPNMVYPGQSLRY